MYRYIIHLCKSTLDLWSHLCCVFQSTKILPPWLWSYWDLTSKRYILMILNSFSRTVTRWRPPCTDKRLSLAWRSSTLAESWRLPCTLQWLYQERLLLSVSNECEHVHVSRNTALLTHVQVYHQIPVFYIALPFVLKNMAVVPIHPIPL